jgi:hypothetical protein
MTEIPLVYTIAEACALAKTSRTVVTEAIAEYAATAAHSPTPTGLRAVKRGRHTLILPCDLEAWVIGGDAPCGAAATARIQI